MKISILIIFLLALTIYSQYVFAKEVGLIEHTEMENYLSNISFKNYRFPFSKLTQNKYPENKHYALIWRDDGVVNRIASVEPASENQIGRLDQTYEEALFELDGHLLEYASFYDDWSIHKTSERIENGMNIVRVIYDRDGNPIEYEALYPERSESYHCYDNLRICRIIKKLQPNNP